MDTTECDKDGCETTLYASGERDEAYCKDHYGSYSHPARGDHDRQAADQRAQENRRHVIDNDRNLVSFEGRR